MEAALEASPEPAREVIALLRQQEWTSRLVGAAAMVLGGAKESTLPALWEALERPTVVLPQLVMAALLVDPDFERNAWLRLSRAPRQPTRDCLVWGLRQVGAANVPSPSSEGEFEHTDRICRQWMKGLRRHVEPRLQATWLPILV